MPPFTMVSFHAHPDDETLLTGGTLARAAQDGHRVVLVTATCGEKGLSGGVRGDLGRQRSAELDVAAGVLGCSRTVQLGYADSGLAADDDPDAFANADVEEAAHRLARILVEEAADVLTVYDARGGYGHPDHVQVHRVGVRAAEVAGTPLVLEATVPDGLFRGALALMRLLGSWVGRSAPLGTDQVFTPGRLITHRVRVTRQLETKRRALAAHGTQRTGNGGRRTVDWLASLPGPLFGLVLGSEWFVERGCAPGRRRDDVFDSLRRA